MQLPKVSIFIPTYQQADVIQTAIESALMQDYLNLEVVVSDDSPDNDTEKLAAQYLHDPRFRYYRNDCASGKAANYRKLLYEYANGEWVVNLDGDDHYINKSFVSDAIKSIFASGPDRVIFYMASQLMAYPHYDQVLQPRLPDDETIMNAGDYVYNIYSIMHFCHLGTVYNARLARESGFYEREIISSDMYSFFKLCLRHPGKQVIISKNIAGKWVQHDANESRDSNFAKHFKNSKYYGSIFSFAQKNKTGSTSKNLGWLLRSLFLYWGSYAKRLFIKRK